jgi:hypothetical protein
MAPMSSDSPSPLPRRKDIESGDLIPLLGIEKQPGLKTSQSDHGFFGPTVHVLTYEPGKVLLIIISDSHVILSLNSTLANHPPAKPFFHC